MSPVYAYTGTHESLRDVLTVTAYERMRAAFKSITVNSKEFPHGGSNSPWSLKTCRQLGINAQRMAAGTTD